MVDASGEGGHDVAVEALYKLAEHEIGGDLLASDTAVAKEASINYRFIFARAA